MDLGTSGVADGARVTHLNGRIEEFLHYVKTRMNRSHRIQAFFQSAQTVSTLLVVLVSLSFSRSLRMEWFPFCVPTSPDLNPSSGCGSNHLCAVAVAIL
ncbi:hypothetical protein Y032_0376g256 [Ancylostoma ceylanicum]|nr:hypothetical protein Y032_0376g256 [Ancylostoma ceylanicum]